MNKQKIIKTALPYLDTEKVEDFKCFVALSLNHELCFNRVNKIIYAMKILDSGIKESALLPMFADNQKDIKIAKYYWRGKEQECEK